MKPPQGGSWRGLWGRLSSRIQEDAAQQVVEALSDQTKVRRLFYTGPFNAFMQRLKWASVGSTGMTIVGSPILLHYFGSSTWSFGTNLFIFGAMGATSLVQSWAAHRSLSRYVLHAYKLVPMEAQVGQTPEDRLELVTMDALGRPKRQVYSAYQLEASPEVGSLLILGHPSRSFVVQVGPTTGFDHTTTIARMTRQQEKQKENNEQQHKH